MSAPGREELELHDELSVESLDPVASDQQAYGRYLLQYEIASGGMASIYLARVIGAAGFERPVAIKRIHPHLAKKRAFVDMFLDEAKLNARITHPNVCSVFDFGEAEGTYFMAMEYLVGQPLSRVLGTVASRPDIAGTMRWQAMVARIVADACQGLHAAHELTDEHGAPLEVVHRDFTPQNIFVTYDGAVKVFDFGVARSEHRRTHTETGLLKGKLAYMSPEQLARASIDRRLDIWAAGVCLWEALTLRRLFVRRSEIETVQAIASAPVRPPSQVRPGIAPELDAIVLRALERDVDRRTPTARILAKELNQFVSTTGVSTTLSDVAELMAELFPEERARKLGVVADVLGTSRIEVRDTSAVQRSQSASVRSALGKHDEVRGGPHSAAAPSRDEALVLDESVEPLAGEATSRTGMELADLLEPLDDVDLVEHGPARGDASSWRPPSSVVAGEGPERGATATESRPNDAPPPEQGLRFSSRRPALYGVVALAAVGACGLAAIGLAHRLVSQGARGLRLELVSGSPGGDSSPENRGVSLGPGRAGEGAAAGAQPDGPSDRPRAPREAGALDEGSAGEPENEQRTMDESDPQGETMAPRSRPAADDDQGSVARGVVNVAARGGWADILVDGAPVGRTPRSLSLPAGAHRVELRRDDVVLVRRNVLVRPGRTERLMFDLRFAE